MFIARLFLKSSTYTHKIAINCPEWLSKRLDRLSVILAYKAVNRALASEGKLVAYRIPKPICSNRCCKRAA